MVFSSTAPSGGLIWLNDTRAGWYTDPGDFVSTNDLRLSSGENTTVRIYSMTIREGETVTLDLVPVQRVTDNAYGFYDKVSGNFYTNTDATFEAGDPIPDPVEIYTDGTDEVLTVSADGAETQTVTDIPMLLSTGAGGVDDEVNFISGIKTGKVRAHVFDGTEADWTFDATYDRAIIRPLPNFKSATTRNIKMLCTHFVSKYNGEPVGDLTVGDFYNATQNGVVFHVAQTSLEDWKAYLAAQYAAGTPVIVIYPRATEVTGQTTAHPELTNQKYTSASADGNVDDITVTVTRGVTSTPTPYNPIPIICNNGEVTGQGAVGTPEVLTLSAAGETDQTATVVDLHAVGDYKDEQDVITGEVTRRIAACVYDGTQEVGDTYISSTGGKDIGAVIVYPLATPATEQVTPQPLICHMGSNTVESEYNVSDPGIKITYPE